MSRYTVWGFYEVPGHWADGPTCDSKTQAETRANGLRRNAQRKNPKYIVLPEGKRPPGKIADYVLARS